MTQTVRVAAAFLLALSVSAIAAYQLSPRASAQILNKEAPIRVGHYHLNVSSIAEHKKFWVDTLGGRASKYGNEETVVFGDVVLFLKQQKPTGERVIVVLPVVTETLPAASTRPFPPSADVDVVSSV